MYPDFVGADKPSAEAVLRDNQLSYVIVEVVNRTTPRGIVMSQTPGAGTRATADTTITLYVSAGAGGNPVPTPAASP
jgi:beta-lactam-binding protein with PASTA domain